MHEFSFTGPVSTTGFKSHFVLAVESEKFPHPRDYAQAYVEEMVAVYEEKQPTRPQRSRSIAEVERTHSPALEDDSSQESAMPKDETQEPNHTTVEVVEELSPEEESDRQRLELKVERAWDEAARALRELRERRLYRSKYKTFEEYCRDRFGFTRQSANFKIAAADVMENLTTKSCQVFPTKETQVRPLTKLKPDEQAQVWSEAVKQNGGKVPSERVVKDAVLRHLGIVERLEQKNASLRELAPGDVVEIKALKRSPLHPFDGMWAIVDHVGSFSYIIRLGIAKDLQQCKAEEMTLIEDEYTADIKAVAQRIAALIQFEIEPFDCAILELLQRSTCFTPRQLLYLEIMEKDYVLSN